MGIDRDDDRTASAAASAAPADDADALGPTLGRYRLDGELGAGAMGVVHAAFDPDLERRVALKVLRRATDGAMARVRLLREARAMARLAHPNVVTVYEVGTASGRDYVAMELIHGESLAEWLRASRPRARAILDALVDAGRGLAAAHAAGIVHRDFKPRNVLRSRDGRVVVTDFGLARETTADVPFELEATLPVGAMAVSPRARAEITATGALLGTPPYMAPEQWRGEEVTPATDQFAYSVTLWEALAGERPYRGRRLDDLHEQIVRGPGGLDASRIPHRLRNVLRRGLDPDPARRWPSMDALLVQLTRTRRRRVAIALGRLAALLTVVGAGVSQLTTSARSSPCDPPARDVASVWSPAIATVLRAQTSDAHEAALAAEIRSWQAARTAACSAPLPVRSAQLHCLDRVLARFDAVRRGFASAPGSPAEDLELNLVDPEVCSKPTALEVPRLTIEPTETVIAAYALLARASTDAKPSDREIASLIDGPAQEPCARGIAVLALDASSTDVRRRRAAMKSAASVADLCGDDRLRADLMIRDIEYRRERPVIGPEGEAAIERAQSAARLVMQGGLAAQLAMQRSVTAGQRDRWDDAFRWLDRASDSSRARGLTTMQLRTVIARNALRTMRALPDDLVAIVGELATWRPVAVAHHQAELAYQLEAQAALARYQLDASGRDDLVRVWRTQPRAERVGGSRRISGEVVDSHGRPVAGATVAASLTLLADEAGIGVPQLSAYSGFRDELLEIATTDSSGHFVMERAVPAGAIAAQRGDLRSPPIDIADHVTLVLGPTRRITGKVDLGGTPATHVKITCEPVKQPGRRIALSTFVARDGSFTITGAPLSAVSLGVAVRDDRAFGSQVEYRILPASPSAITGIAIDIARSTRRIDVLLHSAVDKPLIGASITVLVGKQAVARLGDLMAMRASGMQGLWAKPILGDDYPPAIVDKLRPGDLLARVENARPGDLTVCATSWAGDPLDPRSNRRVLAHIADFVVKCAWIGPTVELVELDVPPQPHFD